MKVKFDRAFALLGAVLFLVTSAALTVAVIWQATQQDNTDKTATTPNQTNTSCQLTQVSASAGTAPTVYKTSSQVTKLQTTDLKPGTGQVAKAGDCLIVKYYGTVADSGKLFDENFTKAAALQFPLGKGNVIQGWDLGLIGMKVGGERRLVIPANQAYGTNPPAGSGIPANAALVFDVELLKIQS